MPRNRKPIDKTFVSDEIAQVQMLHSKDTKWKRVFKHPDGRELPIDNQYVFKDWSGAAGDTVYVVISSFPMFDTQEEFDAYLEEDES